MADGYGVTTALPGLIRCPHLCGTGLVLVDYLTVLDAPFPAATRNSVFLNRPKGFAYPASRPPHLDENPSDRPPPT